LASIVEIFTAPTLCTMSDDDFLGDLGTSKVRPGELSALAQSDMITTHTHQVPPPFSIH
jgi:hypothetical protein